MIEFHPDDALLLAQAAGRLAAGPSLVVAAHVEMCAACRAQVELAERVGGVLLEDARPQPVSAGALARTLAALAPKGERATRGTIAPAHPPLPARVAWPRSLAHCLASPWNWLAPGMRWSRVAVPGDPSANVFLLRIGAGKPLAWHTHTERELTLVMHGRFSDGRTRLGPGDFDDCDSAVHHQPVVEAGSECICLASIEGHVRFDHWLARRLGAVVGM